MARVTVYDVAKHLGLSSSTVSRVLNHSILISDEKSKLILDTALQMGYEKRAIRRQGSRAILNILLILPVNRHAYLHLFYDFSQLLGGLHDGFGDIKLNIITRLANDMDSVMRIKKAGALDGCVFAFHEPDNEIYEYLFQRQIPVLQLNRVNQNRNYVASGSEEGMTQLLDAVRRRRNPKIHFIGLSQVPYITQERLAGLQAACSKAGIVFSAQDDVTNLDDLRQIGPRHLTGMAAQGCNTIICVNDIVAVYIYQAGLAAGLSFPADFALTGYDNSPVQELISQRINTIDFSVAELGRAAGLWLRDQIINKQEASLHRILRSRYVEGDTV